jgi:uracil-DNA glycosylase family 4
MSEYIRGYGPNEARIAFVTDNPLPEDVANKRLLSGQVGRFFDNMLKDAGISRDSVWLTSVSKYEVMPKPKGSKMPWTVRARNSGIDIDQCYSELRTELYQVKPNIICAL